MQRSRSKQFPLVPAALATFALLLSIPEVGISPASAQSWWGSPSSSNYRPRMNVSRARVPRRDVNRISRGSGKKPSAEEVVAAKATASGPLMAVVSIGSQRMTVYDSTGPIIRTPVSTGKAGHRTPTGVFSIIQKNRHHVSNIYSGAPMPYMQRITWSGIALHAGVLPGYPASAGCIRMPYPVAAKLFAMSKMGMRVIVGPHEATAEAFANPALPEPLMIAAPAGSAPETRASAGETASPVRLAAAEGSAEGGQIATRFLNPMQNAALERTRARTRVAEATKANKDLLDASLRASAEANAARAQVQATRAAAEQAKARVSAASGDARTQLEAQLADAERNLAQAIAADEEKGRAAYTAAAASRDAEEAQTKAEDAVKVADRGTEPIAVFISRRESKVFVRQGMVPLFDAPVTFKEPNRPVGTHVYQAMSADTTTGHVTWQAITVPESTGSSETLDNRGPVRRGERVGPQSVGMPSDVNGALDRVEMPAEIKRRIAERLWVNGSIVISDHGISNETGKGTDFIVLTR